MKWTAIAILGLLALSGCSPANHNPSPDQIRQDTANATATAARDTKAIAQGIVQGLKTRGPVNINRATKDQLEALPGIDSSEANRIIADRPYKNSDELLHRHVVSRTEYNRIASHIEAR